MINRFAKYICFTLFMFAAQLSGQISFNAIISKTQVHLNRSFSVTFSIKKSTSDALSGRVNYPNFNNFEQIGSSNAYQEGMYSQTKSVTYVFQPIKTGTFTIGRASVIINGKKYQTKPLKITVNQASNSLRKSKKNTTGKKAQQNQSSELNLNNNSSVDTKLLITTNNLSPYIGQEVFITLRILTTDHNVLQHIRFSKLPRFKSFSSTDYKVKNTQYQLEKYKGKKYYSRIILQKIISAQKAGKVPLNPFQIIFPYLIKTDEKNFFGEPVMRYVEAKLNSNKLFFNVKPLPEKGKPAGFSGAVGSFNLNTFLDRKDANVGESVELDVEISGRGDFKMVEVPKVNQSDLDGLDLYDPGKKKKIIKTKEGSKGKVINNYIIVPQYRGVYKIPELHFSYFNPQTGEYQTKTTPPRTLNIIKGPEKPVESPTPKKDTIAPAKSVDKQKSALGEVFLKSYREKLSVKNKPVLSEKVLWFIIIAVILLIPLIILLLNRLKKGGNETGKRKAKIKKYLKQAKKYIASAETTAFYDAIEGALFHTLTQILKIKKIDFSLSKIVQAMKQRNFSAQDIERVEKIIKECNYQKFSPSSSKDSMKKTYEQTTRFINKLKL